MHSAEYHNTTLAYLTDFVIFGPSTGSRNQLLGLATKATCLQMVGDTVLATEMLVGKILLT